MMDGDYRDFQPREYPFCSNGSTPYVQMSSSFFLVISNPVGVRRKRAVSRKTQLVPAIDGVLTSYPKE